jgi:hypothetical protein
MDIAIDLLKPLGVGAIVVVILGAWLRHEIQERRDERNYSKKRDESLLGALRSITAQSSELEKTLAVLVERVGK